ncbi:hypothetical protein SBOR_7594 [Sclerotinia borealis F-4128]|uniref:BTB domain-containing protein n=1 Tax=Sclerotinia borealis (strain F-4128) TaxID=1432307 RepID=W9C8A5_SCLBF|nr:hypothetical protein SBOR_7594 [Sclerotinia borealis F-4128]
MSFDSKMSPSLRALAKKHKKEGSSIVHIRVGKNLQAFAIEKDILYRHSPYLKGELKDCTEEIGPASIDLPKTEVGTFKLFWVWLYKQKLASVDEETVQWAAETGEAVEDVDSEKVDNVDETNDKDLIKFETESKTTDEKKKEKFAMFCAHRMANLLKLHVFADWSRIPALKNECIKRYYEFKEASGYIATPWVSYVWKHTNKDSLLRKFFLDMLTWEMDPSLFETNPRDFPDNVRLELLVNMGYVIQIARHGSLRLENGNPMKDLTKYFEKVNEEAT